MIGMEEILKKCLVEELQRACRKNLLPAKGSKNELIARLTSISTPENITGGMSLNQLQAILSKYGLPTGGSKTELIARIERFRSASIQESQLQTKGIILPDQESEGIETSNEKGHEFEKRVAAWAKRHFKATSVKTNQLVRGLGKRSYECDVHVTYENTQGIYFRDAEQCDLRIECKNLQSRIKQSHIHTLISKAHDVYWACDSGKEDFYFDRLAFASTSDFDPAALHLAEASGVLCFYFDGKRMVELNEVDIGRMPSWLKRIKR